MRPSGTAWIRDAGWSRRTCGRGSGRAVNRRVVRAGLLFAPSTPTMSRRQSAVSRISASKWIVRPSGSTASGRGVVSAGNARAAERIGTLAFTDSFAAVQACIGSWLGRILLFGWSWSLFYHLCNGIRHLAWDSGWGFELRTTYATGYAVLAASAVLTLAAWIIGYGMMGAA